MEGEIRSIEESDALLRQVDAMMMTIAEDEVIGKMRDYKCI